MRSLLFAGADFSYFVNGEIPVASIFSLQKKPNFNRLCRGLFDGNGVANPRFQRVSMTPPSSLLEITPGKVLSGSIWGFGQIGSWTVFA